MTKTIIAWDLGATNCTAGIIEHTEDSRDFVCSKRHSLKLTHTECLEDLVEQLESALAIKMNNADAICIGAAGQYNGNELYHHNPYPYSMHFGQLAKSLQWPPYAVIHDYATIVCATFTSYLEESQNTKRLNLCDLQPYGRRVACGIGTGLGLKDGILFPDGNFWLGTNEAGHIGVTTPPNAAPEELLRHREIMRFLREDSSSFVTFEKILSGQGIVRLHQFLYPSTANMTPEEVGTHILSGKTEELNAAFAWYAGLFIGTVQLAFMPEGGTWITGGVTINHLHFFDRPDFFAGIHASPAYLTQRAQYPIGVLCNPDHALIGGGYYAARMLITNSGEVTQLSSAEVI